MSLEKPQEALALFSTFIMSLASATMIELGMVEDPIRKEKAQNLPSAKQHIEILSMIQEKTQGNLDDKEKQLVESVLRDLKIHFAKATKG